MIEVDRVSKQFSGVAALSEVSLQVKEGEILGLVGPNGSGKSTLLNVISGFDRPDGGRVMLNGERIDRRPPWEVVERGAQRTFQTPGQPMEMSVMEVMLLGAEMPVGASVWGSLLRRRRARREERELLDRAVHLLEELQLSRLRDHRAARLSGGQQRLLALGAALMRQPQVLLLDEPTAGVNPTLRRTLIDRLRGLNGQGTTLVIVEHDMGFVQDLCSRVYVLDKGQIIACTTPARLVEDPRVVEAYLGSSTRSQDLIARQEDTKGFR